MPASSTIRSLLAVAMTLSPLAAGPGSESAPGLENLPAVHEIAVAAGESPAPGQVAEWAISSGDNRGLPFVVLDKIYGQLYVFDSRGELQALSPVAADESAADAILAGNRVVVYVLPEADSATGSFPHPLRYAARP